MRPAAAPHGLEGKKKSGGSKGGESSRSQTSNPSDPTSL